MEPIMRVASFDIRLERKLRVRRGTTLVVTLASIVLALALGAIVLALTNHPPMGVYRELSKSAFFGWYSFTDTVGAATPLMFTGLAAGIAMRMNLYNIGGEGQLYMGGIASAWAGLALAPGMPGWLAVVTVMLSGAIGGALWAVIPAIARAYFNTSEIVSTLMFNFVALYFMQFLINGSYSYWRDETISGFPQGKEIARVAQLPLWRFPTESLFGIDFPPGVTHIHLGVVFAVVAAVALWVLVELTRFGYDVRVTGDSTAAARYAGIPIRRTIISVMLISGGLAGLAGAGIVAGQSYKLDPGGLAAALGYTGIVIAALARSNPFGVIIVAVLIGGLRSGADNMQSASGNLKIPVAIAGMIQGMILLCALGGELFRNNRIVIRRTAPVSEAVAAGA